MDKIIFIHKNKKVNKIKNHVQNNNSVTNKNNKDLKK